MITPIKTTPFQRTLPIRSERIIRGSRSRKRRSEYRDLRSNVRNRSSVFGSTNEISFTPFDAALVAGVGALSFGLWKLYLYFQLEYITAAMIGNHVPKGGTRILQIGGGTRELYYYPKGTIQVSITQSMTKKGVLENGGIAAKIPVVVREPSSQSWNLGSDGYYDAIVILQKFSNVSDKSTLLKDIHRVLKSDGKLIFVEKNEDLINLLTLDNSLFYEVQSDVALEGKDDHFVGVAKKGIKTGFSTM